MSTPAEAGARGAPEIREHRPQVSVVVATLGRPERLARLLDSLARQSIGARRFEVLVAYDPSDDDTTRVLGAAERSGLPLRRVERARATPPSVARNAAWRMARGAIVAFTDDDCEATPRWLEEGLRECVARPGAIVQGRTEPIPHERHLLGLFSRTIRVERPDPLFQTCNMFYPHAVLERTGGFDERTFSGWGGEDADLAWRAIEAGTGTAYSDRALVHHAVHELGPTGLLRLALGWSDTMAMFRHRGLRRSMLVAGIFWKRSHLAFLLAAAAVVLGRSPLLVGALCLPYGREVGARFKRARSLNVALAPWLVLHDALEIFAAVRGAVRHRVLVI